MTLVSTTSRLPGIPVRAGVALILAALIHFSAWQTLAGIRVLLPREAPATAIDVALLPGAPAPALLPLRRAVVRAAPPPHRANGPAPLTAVRIAAGRAARGGAAKSKRRAGKQPDEEKPKPGTAAAAPDAQAAAPSQAPSTSPPAAPAAQAEASPQARPESLPSGATGQAQAAANGAQSPIAPTPPAETAPTTQTAQPAQPAPAAPAAQATQASPEAATPTNAAPPPQIASAAAPALAAPAHAAVQVVLPKSARFVYDSYGTVRVGGFVLGVRGRTTTRWKFQDGHYQSDLSIDVVNFSESSRGRFDPDFGLEPERYSETRPRRPVATAQFDWTNRRVTFTEDKQQDEAEPGTQDRLSVQFQLSVLRQVYPERFVRGGSMPITLAGTHDVSHWTFTVTGDDIVDSSLGHLPALRVLSNRTTAAGRESLEVWISEKLDWFPARIRMVDKNGNVLDFVVDEAVID